MPRGDGRSTFQDLPGSGRAGSVEVSHDQFNFFLGAGSGNGDYDYYLNGVRQDKMALFSNLATKRYFLGFEYTYQRIGFRFEINRITASKTFQGETAEVEETLNYLTVFIPLN